MCLSVGCLVRPTIVLSNYLKTQNKLIKIIMLNRGVVNAVRGRKRHSPRLIINHDKIYILSCN